MFVSNLILKTSGFSKKPPSAKYSVECQGQKFEDSHRLGCMAPPAQRPSRNFSYPYVTDEPPKMSNRTSNEITSCCTPCAIDDPAVKPCFRSTNMYGMVKDIEMVPESN